MNEPPKNSDGRGIGPWTVVALFCIIYLIASALYEPSEAERAQKRCVDQLIPRIDLTDHQTEQAIADCISRYPSHPRNSD